MDTKIDIFISEYLNPRIKPRKSLKEANQDFDSVKIEQWTQESGICRLSKSFIETNCEEKLDMCRVEEIFRFLMTSGKRRSMKNGLQKIEVTKNDVTHHLFEVYDICLTGIDWDSNSPNKLIKQRNASLLLLIVLDELVDRLDHDRCIQAVISLGQIMKNCEHMEAVLYSLLCVEKIYFNFLRIRIRRIGENLLDLADFLEHVPTDEMFSLRLVPFRYQVGLCARWFLYDQFTIFDTKLDDKLPMVKLSADRFSARTDQNDVFVPVLSSFPVSSGIFYYEIFLVTSGVMLIGWCTREAHFTVNQGLGFDRNSIVLDGHNMVVLHEGEQIQISDSDPKNRLTSWQVGDILGCGIDFQKRQFHFYLNGRKLKLKKKIYFDPTEPYYAAATLTCHQMVYFNFGQTEFKFPPEDLEIQFQSFYTGSNGDVTSFRLMETQLLEPEGSYWFKCEVTGNRVIPYFLDPTQTKFDQWVVNFEVWVPTLSGKNNFQEIEIQFDNLIKCEQDFLRLLQSLIRMLGMNNLHEINDDSNMDSLIEWLSLYFSKIHSIQIEPKMNRILELLHPYTQLSTKYEENVLRHRNLCFAILLISRKLKNLAEIFNSEIQKFLFQILNQSKDEWSLIFVMLCLDSSWNLGKEKSKIQKRIHILSEYKYPICSPKFSPLHYQVAFCARWCMNHVISVTPTPTHWTTPQSIALLDPRSRTENLKLSTDLLSARNDFPGNDRNSYQSIRSAFAVSCGIYFYEVTILTGGSFLIGWSTKRKPTLEKNVPEKNVLDNDQHSIYYDGSSCEICANKHRQVTQMFSRWKAGDVIGCLIDAHGHVLEFTFFVNGKASQKILKQKLKSRLYFATVSLGVHQQCEFNFGQLPFRFPPADCIGFSDFYTKMSTSNRSECQFCCINRASVRYAECNHWKLCSGCFVIYDLCLSPTQIHRTIPFTHKWIISNFTSFFNENSTPLSVMYSDSFPGSDEIMFSLRMIPVNDEEEGDSGESYVSIFLYLKRCVRENVTVNYKITLINSNSANSLFCENAQIFKVDEYWGSEKFVKVNDLLDSSRGFLDQYGSLAILCEVHLEVEGFENSQKIMTTTENQFDCHVKVHKFEYTWEIKNFAAQFNRRNLHLTEPIESAKFSSKESTQSNKIKYYLRLWPKGEDKSNRNFIALYLYLESPNYPTISVHYRLSILNWKREIFHTGEGRYEIEPFDSNNNNKDKDHAQPPGCGSSKFIAREDLLNFENGLLPKDILTIYCKIEEITKIQDNEFKMKPIN